MPETIRPLSEEITDLIRALGGRKLVLLEGPDDQLFFTEVFLNRLEDIAFMAVSGKADVLARIADLKVQRPDVKAFGIIDRDFATDAEVEAALTDPSSKSFLLRRYAIENYALEPAALWNVLRVFLRAQLPHAIPKDLEDHLLGLCSLFRTRMAANFVIRQAGDYLEIFHDRYEMKDRGVLVEAAAIRTGLSVEETDRRIAEREAVIDAAVNAGLDSAYTLINGKHLLYRVWQETKALQKGLTEDHLFSLLVEWHKENPPPHSDLRAIVEDRILAA